MEFAVELIRAIVGMIDRGIPVSSRCVLDVPESVKPTLPISRARPHIQMVRTPLSNETVVYTRVEPAANPNGRVAHLDKDVREPVVGGVLNPDRIPEHVHRIAPDDGAIAAARRLNPVSVVGRLRNIPGVGNVNTDRASGDFAVVDTGRIQPRERRVVRLPQGQIGDFEEKVAPGAVGSRNYGGVRPATSGRTIEDDGTGREGPVWTVGKYGAGYA